ncbi:MAG: alpha-L-fucosidase [Fermentimonas sp.]|nr:alpha-L-fucosidase [Fermentimonas sp.]
MKLKVTPGLKIFAILFLSVFPLSAQVKYNTQNLKPSKEWIDQKFSMFIHFGLYSVYGGVYQGNPVKLGYSEQIQSFAGIFSDWYGETANEFNPVKWNPDSVVALAKAAGMKSIIFTSKHHDGFCMYHSAYTDFNIVDATPYSKDLMKELADACRRGGIGFGVYYSLIDWHYPHAYPISSHNADPLTDEHYEFNLEQVEEIMTNYGDISEIWFDMGSLTPSQSKGLYELVNRLQPGCMISGRLGNDYVDFAVMADNEYPDYKMGITWQTAASMFDETWGYRSWQVRGDVQEKIQEKISSLIKVISRGGNYLLNIGPRGDGSIVEYEKEVLHGIGDWISKNSEAIYGVKANPFHTSFDWGDVTTNNDNIYAFVSKQPSSSIIELSGFSGEVKNVELLSTGKPLSFTQKGDRLEIQTDEDAQSSKTSNITGKITGSANEFGMGSVTGSVTPVIKVSFVNGFTVKPSAIITNGKLTTVNSSPVFGHSSLNYYAGYKSLIGYDWSFKTRKNNITPKISFTESEVGRSLSLEIEGIVQTLTLQPRGQKKMAAPKGSVLWSKLYRKPGRGVFGNLEEEGIDYIYFDQLSADENSSWNEVADFNYGETYTERISPRQSIVFLQQIESDRDQTVAVKLGSGNGVYILLNGSYITAHLSPERLKYQEEIVLLPLKKGVNQLVVKYYNGYEKELSYSITPLDEWVIYENRLTPQKLQRKEYHSLSLIANDPDSYVSPLRLNNIIIEL